MTVEYRVEDHVAVITLNHGELNTLTPAMHRQMHETMLEFLGDPEVHCGVIKGAGERAFCAGDDLKSQLPELPDAADQLLAEITPLHRRAGGQEAFEWARDVAQLDRFKPIVAAVHGWCLGGGMGILIGLSDVRLASPDARFGLPEIAYGMGGAGAMLRLSHVIPRTSAMAMLLTGEPIDAVEALRIHLINEIVDADKLNDRAMEIARKIAAQPPLSVRLEMEGTIASESMTPREALLYGERLYQLQRLAIGETEASSFTAARAKTIGRKPAS